MKKIKYTPQKVDGELVTAKTTVEVRFDLPNKFDFHFDNNIYKMVEYSVKNSNRNFYASIKKGEGGKKLNFTDEVKIEYTFFDEKGKEISAGAVSGMIGINEFIPNIDRTLLEMSTNDEAYILIKNRFIYGGMIPMIDNEIRREVFLMKIKVL